MFLAGLVIGLIFGILFTTIFITSKKQESDDEYIVDKNNLQGYYTEPFNNVKLEGFKSSLKRILKNDIEFYTKLYQSNKGTYYLGRIEQCQFILNIIEGKQ